MSSLPLHLIFVSILLIFWCCFFYVALLCIFAFLVLICDVRYNFSIKPMFGSSLPLFVCRWAHVLFMLFVFVCVKWIYEAGTAYPSRASGFTPVFLVGSVLLIYLFFCVVFNFSFLFYVFFCLVCLMSPVLSDCPILIAPFSFLWRLFQLSLLHFAPFPMENYIVFGLTRSWLKRTMFFITLAIESPRRLGWWKIGRNNYISVYS